jgi:hypothetical protein
VGQLPERTPPHRRHPRGQSPPFTTHKACGRQACPGPDTGHPIASRHAKEKGRGRRGPAAHDGSAMVTTTRLSALLDQPRAGLSAFLQKHPCPSRFLTRMTTNKVGTSKLHPTARSGGVWCSPLAKCPIRCYLQAGSQDVAGKLLYSVCSRPSSPRNSSHSVCLLATTATFTRIQIILIYLRY